MEAPDTTPVPQERAQRPSVDSPDPADIGRGAQSSRRAVIVWASGTLATLLVFVGVVVALNSTVYSASGFVGRYLDALQRRDLATALELPGVTVPTGADTSALTRLGTAALDETRVVGEGSGAAGRRTVDVEWREGDQSGMVRLEVEPVSPIAGLFGNWRFVASPVIAVPITVLHADSFRANGVAIEAPTSAGPGAAGSSLAALVLSKLVLDHESAYLTAATSTVVVDGRQSDTTVDVGANELFVTTVQRELDEFLDACTQQQVLQPGGCPFGKFVDDRLLAPPVWTMVDYPVVTVQPGEDLGMWMVPSTPGVAHIAAEVISLFDGTRSNLDEDVPFQVSYRIEIESGTLRIVGTDG
jgi:hypothetical protein